MLTKVICQQFSSVSNFLSQKYKVVFLRHGESIWNKENKFTGWTDVRLSASGLSSLMQAFNKQSKPVKLYIKMGINLISASHLYSPEPFKPLIMQLMNSIATISQS